MPFLLVYQDALRDGLNDGSGWEAMLRTYKTFVFGEEHGDSSVDLADSQ